ncbi:hypothetical protein [Sorangium sp. So ce1151]|uniref:hypothetical protein n=1 Tax=Sorangium sp. So ce1151 TaxID=3133332 RepID=UPI003F643C4A
MSQDLAAVAASAAREGCVGETLAAVLAAEQLGQARDPAVRAVYRIRVMRRVEGPPVEWGEPRRH